MDPLPPIPIPASSRWREFRIRVLPGLIFASAVITAAVLWRHVVSTWDWPPQAPSLATEINGLGLDNVAQLPSSFQATPRRSNHHSQGQPAGNSRLGGALTYDSRAMDAASPHDLSPSSNLLPRSTTDLKEGNRN